MVFVSPAILVCLTRTLRVLCRSTFRLVAGKLDQGRLGIAYMNALRNNTRLVFVILGLVVATLGIAAVALVLSGRTVMREWLELLPFVAAACVLVASLTITVLKRARPAPEDDEGVPLRTYTSASTGLRTRGAIDSGGWTARHTTSVALQPPASRRLRSGLSGWSARCTFPARGRRCRPESCPPRGTTACCG